MSTRSTTHFKYGVRVDAIIYRHYDGYPESAGADIQDFLKQLSVFKDTRFNDPSYLAARYVVFLADKFRGEGKHLCEFTGVGVLNEDDPGDIDYRYTIDCSEHDQDGLPIVTCTDIGDGETKPLSGWL